MNEKSEALEKRDYSCEAMSAVVLIVLSALSHFWYIAIVAGVGIVAWGALLLLGHALLSTSVAQARELDKRLTALDLESQVFPPGKIRRSVDCYTPRIGATSSGDPKPAVE